MYLFSCLFVNYHLFLSTFYWVPKALEAVMALALGLLQWGSSRFSQIEGGLKSTLCLGQGGEISLPVVPSGCGFLTAPGGDAPPPCCHLSLLLALTFKPYMVHHVCVLMYVLFCRRVLALSVVGLSTTSARVELGWMWGPWWIWAGGGGQVWLLGGSLFTCCGL